MIGNDLRYNLKTKRSNPDGRLSLLLRLQVYAWFVAVFLGLAYCIYGGALKLLFWMADYEGRWTLALMAAVFGAGFVLVSTERMAREFAEAEEAKSQD
jgi:hypothetical protein